MAITAEGMREAIRRWEDFTGLARTQPPDGDAIKRKFTAAGIEWDAYNLLGAMARKYAAFFGEPTEGEHQATSAAEGAEALILAGASIAAEAERFSREAAERRGSRDAHPNAPDHEADEPPSP